ncbi:MAG: two component, sigma54 specific, transcriptional regulator, Fis family [Verrucomicrobiales bacterium]|nr:two component, sigma54 specific, transcriptional regulator, Fis family [Verrucomicrobiales bacterium]
MDILIIDDDRSVREATLMAVESLDHYGEGVETSAQGLTRLREDKFDLVILDLMLGDENGLDVLSAIKKQNPSQPVVMFTAQATIATAVEATRRGAIDFIEKPFHLERLRHVLALAQKTRHLETRVAELETEVRSQNVEPQFSSQDPSVQSVLDLLFRAATSSASILILGQSGTGKSVAARAVHAASHLKDKPLVTVSCPSLSKELLESDLFGHVKGAFTGAIKDHWGKVKAAEGGTLFLDEIGELPLELQPKLLRLLQEREYERLGENKTRTAEVRVIAATNRDLEKEVAAGRFREDLFYRLNVITVTMPSLRDRPSDLLVFAENYLKFFAGQMKRNVKKFSAEAVRCILSHPWQGNLRELRNSIERAVILSSGPEILPKDLPQGVQDANGSTGLGGRAGVPGVGSMITLEELEREHIRRVVEATPTIQEAARILGIDAATIYRKRRKHEEQAAAAAAPAADS